MAAFEIVVTGNLPLVDELLANQAGLAAPEDVIYAPLYAQDDQVQRPGDSRLQGDDLLSGRQRHCSRASPSTFRPVPPYNATNHDHPLVLAAPATPAARAPRPAAGGIKR
jgi:hypothetical protein